MDNNGIFSGMTEENNAVENHTAENSGEGYTVQVNAESAVTGNLEAQQESAQSNTTPGTEQTPYSSPYDAQNVYSSAYDAQNTQGVYTSNYGSDIQNPYASTYNNTYTQNTYSSTYDAQSVQNGQNAQSTQYAYENQINQGTQYTYGNQNNQTVQNTQSAAYSYGNNTNQSAPNFYADSYSYNGQNNNYQGYQDEMELPVSMGEWLLMFILLAIPCVGLVLAIVWAFSKTEKKSKVNYCKAYLVMMLISLVFSLVISSIMLAVML